MSSLSILLEDLASAHAHRAAEAVIASTSGLRRAAADGQHAVRLICTARLHRMTLGRIVELSACGPAPVLVLVDEDPNAYAARVLADRVGGSLVADEHLAEVLPAAVAALAAGLDVHPRAFRERRRRPGLTAREKQVLAMIVLDLPNAEIARRLSVTEAGVKNVLTAAFAKLGVRSRAAAAELILDADAGLGPGILRLSSDGLADVAGTAAQR